MLFIIKNKLIFNRNSSKASRSRILAPISNFGTYLGCRENFLVSLRVPRAKKFENHGPKALRNLRTFPHIFSHC
jgi:hypothetical protein